MDRFARRFVVLSIVYLGIASIVGIGMLASAKFMALKFVHSHLMLLGWVSMMIFGVGYHILPRFMGRPLYSRKLGEVQFWSANVGMIGMLLFYTLNVYDPAGGYVPFLAASGALETISIFLFFANMLMTLGPAAEQPH